MQWRRLIHAVLGVALVGVALVVPQSPASAATQGPYLIFGWQSEKCVNNPGSSPDNNVTMIIYTCSPRGSRETNEQWYFTDTDSGYYNIWNRASGKCLTVKNNSTANNAAIIQYTCTTGNNEEWRTQYLYTDMNSGLDFYWIISRSSGKCLTVKNASSSNGATLLQYTCNNGGNQQWTWVA